MLKLHHHHNQQQQEHDDDDTIILPLISNARVIEYLIPTMSHGLLSMFPDDNSSSSFPNFDHSQSSIWSPLVPRRYVSSLDPEGGKRKKIQGCGGIDLRGKKKKKKRRSISSEDAKANDGACGCIPFSAKGWNKMMKAASRQFKKRKNSTIVRLNLSNSKLS